MLDFSYLKKGSKALSALVLDCGLIEIKKISAKIYENVVGCNPLWLPFLKVFGQFGRAQGIRLDYFTPSKS